ncbi:MAG TPA: GntR family transcriptional regulator [Candidatus Acidoferrum sp.]|jgi:DNA-binding GntR family transcriptional regulator|nr:GntR family transcriptional regulator [Candidatus Acidoferrum sp.]
MASSATSSSRVETVVMQLRQGVFEGRYPPGTALRELTLARELSVSQATIREALQQLQYTGLVTRTPNVGSMVTRLSVKEVRERVELRTLLEVKAALEARTNMGQEEFAELERRLAALETAVASDSYFEAAQADLEFHRYIWQCSGNETICRHLELVTVPLFAFISILRSQGLERLVNTVEGHRPLVDALRSGSARQIRVEFEKGATSAYGRFLGGDGHAVLAAFGLLDPVAK